MPLVPCSPSGVSPSAGSIVVILVYAVLATVPQQKIRALAVLAGLVLVWGVTYGDTVIGVFVDGLISKCNVGTERIPCAWPGTPCTRPASISRENYVPIGEGFGPVRLAFVLLPA
jgi:hypothetical protein